ncbi:MAG: PEP-utilizing enzyme [Polyangiales bacterium]
MSETFTPPGPGVWELETTHFTRPLSHFTRTAFQRGFAEGFAEGTARYGLMLSHFKTAIVNDLTYMQAVPFGAPEGAKGPPPKIIFQLLTRLHPKIRRRIRDSHEAFSGKLWRDDLERWDKHVKPKSIARHREIQTMDPTAMSDEELIAHVVVCRDHFEAMIKQHHHFTATCTAPVGDYLAHTLDWTKLSPGELLAPLKGSSPISRGIAATELVELGAAIREDASARELLEKPPAEVLGALRAHGGKVGEHARAYLDLVEHRCLGYDVSEKRAGEMPDVLVRAIRAATSAESAATPKDAGEKAKESEIRARVPEMHRARFDELLAEARHMNRLRDERGHYSDGWAAGLARRALLEVGKRLKKTGKVKELEDAVDLTADEIAALLRGGSSPSPDEIGKRVHIRSTKKADNAPPFLGGEPSGPPPVEWFPEHGRRAARAISAFIGNMFVEPPTKATTRSCNGLPVSPGVYEGTARLVENEEDFGRIHQGDVLVTRATSPYFNVVLPLLGAIVTDRGGQLCHAAIVSREYGIPGVVGTREATKLVKDGDRVRVDGSTGLVEVLG